MRNNLLSQAIKEQGLGKRFGMENPHPKEKEGEKSVAKPTNKERDQQLQWLMNQMSHFSRILGSYIDYKGDGADFQKHLIDLNEEMKKKAKNDTKTTDKPSDKGDSETVQAR